MSCKTDFKNNETGLKTSSGQIFLNIAISKFSPFPVKGEEFCGSSLFTKQLHGLDRLRQAFQQWSRNYGRGKDFCGQSLTGSTTWLVGIDSNKLSNGKQSSSGLG